MAETTSRVDHPVPIRLNDMNLHEYLLLYRNCVLVPVIREKNIFQKIPFLLFVVSQDVSSLVIDYEHDPATPLPA